jgi:hypothetical protein
MILDEPASGASAPASHATLDAVFSRAVRHRPDAVALIDPFDRWRITGGSPKRLSFADVDSLVSGIAARLHRLRLPVDSVVGIQLPNTVEGVLAILGVLRAGMIAAPLPLLWRRVELAAALDRVGAKAFITCTRVGSVDHADLARHVAADVFSIRHVGAFGAGLPDGVVSFDDLDTSAESSPVTRSENPAAHVAMITFDMRADGLVPVARNHAEILAGGIAILLEAQIAPHATIIATLPPSSFAGLASGLVPWLLASGTLVLHHAFDEPLLAEQLAEHEHGALVAPGPLLAPLAEAGLLRQPRKLLAAWRSPERIAAAPAGRDCIDLYLFGETGLLAARRDPAGRPVPIPFGGGTGRHASPGTAAIDLQRTEQGTLAIRGAMVPRAGFPPGITRSALPHLAADPLGFVDTGFTCRLDRDDLVLTGAPVGVAVIGGYRFPLRQAAEALAQAGQSDEMAVLPHPLLGHRLVGLASDLAGTRAELTAQGANPLLVAAFDPREAHGEAA